MTVRATPASAADRRGASQAINLWDLREAAKRRLPRAVFELINSASEDNFALAAITSQMNARELLPRVLRGVEKRNQETMLFGRNWSTSFGIAPTGTIGVLRRDIEYSLAEAALASNIPMVLSGASRHSLEDVAKRAPGQVWSQLYAATDPKITADLVARAEACGSGALVWTVDLPVFPKNDRQQRLGYGIPPRPRLCDKFEALLHPSWLIDYLRGGTVGLDHWRKYVPAGSSDHAVHQYYLSQRNALQSWREMELLRRLWKGPLVLKGILNPEDAIRAAELGADGIIVSNHGGFGLDRMPASIDVLPSIVAAVGDRLTVMLDSGVRRGADVLLARALGAKFVFVGRAALYGATAYGTPGAIRAIDILKNEIDRNLGQIGCPDLAELDASYVVPKEMTRVVRPTLPNVREFM